MRKIWVVLLLLLIGCSQVEVVEQLNEKYKTDAISYPSNYPKAYTDELCQLTGGLKDDCVDKESALGLYAAFRYNQIIADEEYLKIVNNKTKLASDGFRCGDLGDVQQGSVEVNASVEKSKEALKYLGEFIDNYPLQAYYLEVNNKIAEQLSEEYNNRSIRQAKEARTIFRFCTNSTNVKELPIKVKTRG